MEKTENDIDLVFDEKIMRIALLEADKAYEIGEVPVGCVFIERLNIKEYKIMSQGHNQTIDTNNATLHCEIVCINQIKSFANFKNIILYVTCEPCIMCAYALNIIGIKKVIFGCKNERFGGNGSILSLNSKIPNPYSSKGGILEKEGLEILKKFYERGNKKLPENLRHRKKIKIN